MSVDILASSCENSKPKKTKSARLQSGKRYALGLLCEHELHPFTHKADLTILSPFAYGNFRRNLKSACKGLFDAVVFKETAQGDNSPHFHFVIRAADLTKSKLRELIIRALKNGRHDKKKAKVDLRFTKIEEKLVEGGFKYAPKATWRLLSKIELGQKGERIAFRIGRPFSGSIEVITREARKRIALFLAISSNPFHPFWDELA